MFNLFAKRNQQPSAGLPPASMPVGGPQPVPANQSQPPAANLEHHKAVITHFNQLLQAGYDPASVQAQWQQYYDQLGDTDKVLVNQLMSNPQPQHQPQPQPPPAHTAAEAEVLDEDDESPMSQPVASQVDYNNYQETDATSGDSRTLNRFFGASVALKKYNAWQSLTKKKKVIPASASVSALDSPTVPMPGGGIPGIPSPPVAYSPLPAAPAAPPEGVVARAQTSATKTKVSGESLSARARSALYWNSNSALFDENESKSIMHQNYKSIFFGLTIGVIMMTVWQFDLLYQRFIQPFIQPSAASDVQILVSPEIQEINDPTFRLLIPNLGISAIVYDELEPKSADETFAAFEKRVQDGLLKGVLHYPTSQFPGQNGDGFNSNIVIMGHSSGILLFNDSSRDQKYKFIFKQLNQLEEGNIIQIYYKKNQYTYRIYQRKVVKPNAVEVLRSGSENPDLKHNGTLTLITCEPPGTVDFRLVLLAEQILPAANSNSEVQTPDGGEDEDFVPGETPGFFN